MVEGAQPLLGALRIWWGGTTWIAGDTGRWTRCAGRPPPGLSSRHGSRAMRTVIRIAGRVAWSVSLAMSRWLVACMQGGSDPSSSGRGDGVGPPRLEVPSSDRGRCMWYALVLLGRS